VVNHSQLPLNKIEFIFTNNCILIAVKSRKILPFSSQSLINWCLTSICFVFEHNMLQQQHMQPRKLIRPLRFTLYESLLVVPLNFTTIFWDFATKSFCRNLKNHKKSFTKRFVANFKISTICTDLFKLVICDKY